MSEKSSKSLNRHDLRQLVIGVTGASGAIYAKRFVELASDFDLELLLIASKPGLRIFAHELGEPKFGPSESPLSWMELADHARERITELNPGDIGAGPASGTFGAQAMAVVPCSMRTLAGIAAGFSDNLIGRSADVMIKERRPLVLVPREAPFSAIHLENMLKLSRLGVSIVPANPGFYHRPESIVDLADHVVHKALSQLGLEHKDAFQWKGE
jgi:4-hydroxy-3-polyprenylbenzoate decarboxylase